jgi:hypothetical protein
MSYNQHFGYGQPQYPQHGGYGMGMHSPQGGYMGGHTHPHEHVLGFFREVAEGKRQCPEELRAVILGVVGEQANGMLAQYGYQHQGDPEHHHRYKETLEELRDIPQVTEAVKRASQHFDNLTEEDRKVLQQILNRPSYKKMAQMVNMTPERFMEVKRELEWKLK